MPTPRAKPRSDRSVLADRPTLSRPRQAAKALLRAARAGEVAACDRVAQFGFGASACKLADAQFVVARELGFASWSGLKHHVEHLAELDRAIAHDPPPDGGLHTMHVRCGDDIRAGLAAAGFVGTFGCFADPYCQGPVPNLPADEFIATRAAFVADGAGVSYRGAMARLRSEYDALVDCTAFARVVLWFEHDSYDQLILAAVLDTLRRLEHPCVEIVCIDDYPGVGPFLGLGQLSPARLRGLWSQRRALSQSDYELGTAVWRALRAPDPTALDRIARAGTPAIVPMARALQRHLAELPGVDDGLGLTERLTLQAIAGGASRAGLAFRVLVGELEPLPFLGDTMFWWVVKQLAGGPSPAIAIEDSEEPWPSRGVALTDVGHALLTGDVDWIALARPDRWIGGVHCADGHAPWRRDREHERLLRGS